MATCNLLLWPSTLAQQAAEVKMKIQTVPSWHLGYQRLYNYYFISLMCKLRQEYCHTCVCVYISMSIIK